MRTETRSNTVGNLQYALYYARLGWPVFPQGGKKPVRGTHGFNGATTDEVQIRALWMRWPYANIGLATGAACWALDVDPDKGGQDSLDELIARHGLLPDTVMQASGGGGTHYLFAPDKRITKSVAGRIGRGLDIRTFGGCLTVYPSIHPDTGARYEWVRGRSPIPLLGQRVIRPIPAPAWLVDLAIPPPEPEYKPLRIDPDTRSAYGEKAINAACSAILDLPPGQQNEGLHRHSYSIGRTVGAGLLDQAYAERCLIDAGMQMVNGNAKWPWRHGSVSAIVQRGVARGMRNPRPT